MGFSVAVCNIFIISAGDFPKEKHNFMFVRCFLTSNYSIFSNIFLRLLLNFYSLFDTFPVQTNLIVENSCIKHVIFILNRISKEVNCCLYLHTQILEKSVTFSLTL